MKILVLAFDGLEYGLVNRFRQKSLKQTRCSQVVIPKECYVETIDPLGNTVYEAWSPFVWATFLTGKLPSQIGLKKEKTSRWNNKLLQFLRVLSIKAGLSKIPNKGVCLKKLGFTRSTVQTFDYPCPTIFGHAKNPRTINVPTISEEWSLKLKTDNFNEIVFEYWRQFRELKQRLFGVVNADWDLLMFYTRLLDIVGELCYGDFRQMFKAYAECNRLISEIKCLLPKETLLLVVSDHGMRRFGKSKYGRHSDYGFWSCNYPISPRRTTDFFDIIVEKLSFN